MDLEVVRTFLEIAESGSFKAAADRLHLTQSTVSTRIRLLEDQLGQALFVRGRSGITLTAPGRHFREHAVSLLNTWQRAKHEASLPPSFAAGVSVGGQVSLWDRLLLQWLSWMRRNMPAVAVRAEVGSSAELMLALINGLLDFAVIYSPQQRGHIAVEPLLTEQLVLVESPGAAALENRGFIFVDWGPEFLSAYTQRFPDMPPPPITVGLGLLGLHYILENGGSGYFPLRLVQPELAAGRLARAADAPVFTRPAYLAYPRGRDEPWFDNVLQGLRAVAGATAGQDAG